MLSIELGAPALLELRFVKLYICQHITAFLVWQPPVLINVHEQHVYIFISTECRPAHSAHLSVAGGIWAVQQLTKVCIPHNVCGHCCVMSGQVRSKLRSHRAARQRPSSVRGPCAPPRGQRQAGDAGRGGEPHPTTCRTTHALGAGPHSTTGWCTCACASGTCIAAQGMQAVLRVMMYGCAAVASVPTSSAEECCRSLYGGSRVQLQAEEQPATQQTLCTKDQQRGRTMHSLACPHVQLG